MFEFVTFFHDEMKRLKEKQGQTPCQTNNVEQKVISNIFLRHDILILLQFFFLKALDQNKVDYLSLDVEGNELDILKTIPFDKINVKVKYFF